MATVDSKHSTEFAGHAMFPSEQPCIEHTVIIYSQHNQFIDICGQISVFKERLQYAHQMKVAKDAA